MKFSALLIIFFIVLYSCSPVRNRGTIKRGSDKAGIEISADTTANSFTNKERFSDTTLIMLPTITAERSNSLSDDFDIAVRMFDDEKYDEACPKLKTYAETLTQGDSLYYEARFFYSECLLQQNKIAEGKSILMQIENDPMLTDIVNERVLVRLGQIYCVEKDQQKAEDYFKLLRNTYPESIYIPLADCDVVK